MALKTEVLRVIDANLNRSREGLRVCEDITRFVLNSRALTEQLKGVRHGISAIARTTLDERNAARDSKNDVGREPLPAIEIGRRSVADIFDANIERAKESIRVLEEFFKLMDMKGSAKLTALRFEVYDIEARAIKKIALFRGKKIAVKAFI